MTDTQETPSAGTPPSAPPEIAAAPALNVGAVRHSELIPSSGQSDLAAKAQFAANQDTYITTYIGLADTKAAWVFATPAAAIGYLSAQRDAWALIMLPGHCGTKALAIIAVVLLLFSAAAAFSVIVPRLGGASTGLVYFGAVAARKSAASYLADLAPLSEAALVDARLSHNFELARVCSRKYAALRFAMWSGLAALVATLALVAVLKVGVPVAVAKSAITSAPGSAATRVARAAPELSAGPRSFSRRPAEHA